jgi:hypothetical protein
MSRPRHIHALGKTLGELVAAEDAGDDAEIFRLNRAALSALYDFEEAERRSDSGYYAHRDASACGSTLGGLMWLRGAVVHQQAESRDVGAAPAQISVLTEDENGVTSAIPATLSVLDGKGGATPILGGTATQGRSGGSLSVIIGGVCPPRSRVHSPMKETKGRDLMYDERVAGEKIISAYRAAERYLVKERAVAGE